MHTMQYNTIQIRNGLDVALWVLTIDLSLSLPLPLTKW